MNFKEFLKKQASIYDEFRDMSAIERDGLVPKIPDYRGGYVITFQHPDNIMRALEKFSHRASEILPAIKYGTINAHTTISDFQVQDNFSPHSKILDELAQIVYASKPFFTQPIIYYDEWLLNQNTGIAAGKPNRAFFDLAMRIVSCAQQHGIQLRFPWGAHITTNRFLRNGSNEEIKELLNFYKRGTPLGQSLPNYINIGYFIFTHKEFELNVYKKFILK